jgi:hypothetical protein
VPLHLRRARTTRVNIEANTGICRGMLRQRYGSPGAGEQGEGEQGEGELSEGEEDR